MYNVIYIYLKVHKQILLAIQLASVFIGNHRVVFVGNNIQLVWVAGILHRLAVGTLEAGMLVLADSSLAVADIAAGMVGMGGAAAAGMADTEAAVPDIV